MKVTAQEAYNLVLARLWTMEEFVKWVEDGLDNANAKGYNDGRNDVEYEQAFRND